MLVALILFHSIDFAVPHNFKGFIVGGDYVTQGNFTYAVFLNIKCMDCRAELGYSWRCGSSILNQYVTLTAAHCVVYDRCKDLVIHFSAGNVNIHKGTIGSVHSYFVHDDYQLFKNDIALVRLSYRLIFGPEISRVAIMRAPPYREPAEIAGWGQIHPTKNKMSDSLKYSRYTVLEEHVCQQIFDELPNGAFCASNTRNGHISNGDSGSALVVRGYIQIGISSFFIPGTENTAAAFTDVGYFYDWIIENVEKILCNA